MRFEVWAPGKERVELHVAGDVRAMERAERGWWRVDVPGLAPEVDYAFALDGGEPLKDPRSRWQPEGVGGRSRTLDVGSLPFEVDSWRVAPFAHAVIYELHVGTYTPAGTFESAIERLDHLLELGVTHVELMPVNGFPGARGWGYDGVDLFAPHEPYGGPRGLARLVDACHARGLGVLLDVVYNHLGPLGNVLPQYGPYFTDRYATPWGGAPNFDGPESDEVRRFFVDNALQWLRDYRMDGLRVDATHAIVDSSAYPFLEELTDAVRALERELGRPLAVIAEDSRNDPRFVRPPSQGGLGFDAQWSDDFHHALHAVLTAERAGYYADYGSVADLAKALDRVYVLDGRYSRFHRCRRGRPAGDLPGERFVVAAQTHDQVGNRAVGERLSMLTDDAGPFLAAALLLTSPCVPMLFQGEEWGARTPFQYFTDHPDPELGRLVREGRRAEFASFGWAPEDVPDPQDEATFRRSKLDWSELEREPHALILAWHRELLRLRREHPAFATTGRAGLRVRFDEEARWLAVARGTLELVVNLAGDPRRVPLADEGSRRVLLASKAPLELSPTGAALPPRAAVLVERG